MKLSLVIPAKSKDDPKLAELLSSIDAQDFPKSEMETLVITEGTSESAKAIGIRKARGEVIGILASDNELTHKWFLKNHYMQARKYVCSYPSTYACVKNDDVLNRYFALIGGNDPLSFYMGKNDRLPYYGRNASFKASNITIGDNGFFIRKELLQRTDLDNYYHIDNATEAIKLSDGGGMFLDNDSIWHKTGGNLFHFFAKRYRYGLQHAFNSNRRWHLVDFRKPQDIGRFLWFILATITMVEPLYLSFRGYTKIRDKAWFLHLPVCMLTLITYGILSLHLVLRSTLQSLSAPLTARSR